MEEIYFSPKEAAEYLTMKGRRVKKETLATWRCAKKGPHFEKFGTGRNSISYKKKDLDKYLLKSRARYEF